MSFLSRFVPEKICEILTYLKYSNPLCSDVQIDEDNIMKLLVNDSTEEIPIALNVVHQGNGSKANDTTTENEKEIINPLQKYQQQTSESLIVNNSIHEIELGESLLRKKIIFDQNYEELAFP